MGEQRVLADRFRVVRELGSGGAGTLLLVEDLRRGGSPCALKILRPRVRDPGLEPLFRREFLLLSSLRHEGIVPVREFGLLDTGEPYFTMDFLSGEDARAFVIEDRLEGDDLLDLASGVLGALAHLHAGGILHRDLKPANIVVRRIDGRLKPVLVDFGLSSLAGRPGDASGTIPYVAPEVIAGAIPDARADLFSLGMTLYEIATGRRLAEPPEVVRSPVVVLAPERVRRALRGSARPWVPKRFEEFVSRLMAPVPAARYPSAAAALAALRDLCAPPSAAEGRGGAAAGGTPASVAAAPTLGDPPMVGRAGQLEMLLLLLEALREGTLLDPIVTVAGKPGLGVTRLLAALRNHAAAAGIPVSAGSSLRELVTDLVAQPGSQVEAPEPGETADRLVFRADAVLQSLPPKTTPLLILDDVHLLPEGDCAALRQWISALEKRPGRARCLFTLGGRSVGDGDGVAILRTAGRNVSIDLRDLPPLEVNDVRLAIQGLLGDIRAPAPFVQTIHGACEGSPSLLVDLLRLLGAEEVLGFEGGEPVIRAERLAGLRLPRSVTDAARARFERLAPDHRKALATFALLEEGVPLAAAQAILGDVLGPLVHQRWLLIDRGQVRFLSEVAKEAADTLPRRDRPRYARQAAGAIRESAPWAAAPLHLLAGEPDEARAAAVEGAQRLRSERRMEEAERWLARLPREARDARVLREHCEVLGTLWRTKEAAEAGLAALGELRGAEEFALTVAGLLIDSLQAEKALALLRRLDAEARPAYLPRALNAKAAALSRLGRHEEALLESGRAEAAAGSLLALEGRIARTRANILRRCRRNRAALALESAILSDPGCTPGARLSALVNRALLLRRVGRPAAAVKDCHEVLRASREAEHAHLAAHACHGLALAFLDLGRAGRAARLAERGRRAFEIRGRAEQARDSLVVESEALLECGRAAEAESRLVRLETIPGGAGSGERVTWARALRAKMLALGGRPVDAEALLHGQGDAESRMITAQCTTLSGDLDRAATAWRAALAAAARERRRDLLCGIRVGIAESAAARGAWHLAESLASRGRGEVFRWKTPARAATLFLRAGAALQRGDASAATRFLEQSVAVANRSDFVVPRAQVYASAATLLGEVDLQRALRRPTGHEAAALLESARDVWSLFGNEPMLRKIDLHLSELPRAAERADGPDTERLVKVLHIVREMNREFDRDRLLGLILDRAIELTQAERGFVILLQDGKEEVHLARNIDRESVQEPETKVSTWIVREVIRNGRPIISQDAVSDQRFDESLSVRQLRLRSIIAVPFRSDGKTIGALYLDNRFRVGHFTEREERLLELFADQAVAAIEKAQLIGELEQRQRELADLYEQEKSRLKNQGRELHKIRQEVKAHRRARGWTFDRVVARSVAMQGILREAKRVAASDIPLLLVGENGTGKEVIARAVHYASARQAGPFQAINCAALPDNLLENELFGHVRGGFTGADRDHAGVFEEANGGTLFLDEVGEMSLAMQVKLLRALDQGEIRRVGDSAVRTLDVRIISATNADLDGLIAKGRFRSDLYWRLCGFSLKLPPLRERAEDIEPLAYAFVEECALREGRLRVKLGNDALARLESYNWPGNVREMRNVIQRAVLSCAGEVIGPDDIVFDVRGPSVLPGFDPGRADRVVSELAARGHDLNDRQRAGVSRVLTRGRLEYREYQSLLHVSKSTAARDLQDLVSWKVLEKRGKTRAVVYIAGPILRDLAIKVGGNGG